MSVEQSPQPVRESKPSGKLPPTSNSHVPIPSYKKPENFSGGTGKDETIRVKKVVKGTVQVKPGLVKKFTQAFIAEDLKTAMLYILADKIVPGIKETVLKGLEIVLFGSGSSGGRTVRRDGRGVTDYNSSYRRDRERTMSERERLDREREERMRRANHDFDDIRIPSRGEAERILDTLREAIDVYDKVTVADFYVACGLDHEYTDNRYGWEDLRDVPEPRRVRDGYILQLPRPKVLD